MSCRVLITGSAGLVGTALRVALQRAGHEVVGFDLRGVGGERGDVRDRGRVREAVEGCQGVVHLAAVSRVVWGERDPELCRAVNVGGLRTVIDAAAERRERPWLVFASSREVYGEPREEDLPVVERAPLRPVNVYGHTKVEGEEIVDAAGGRGVRTAIVRLSNVYGGFPDHEDRVVPAFVRAAIAGRALRVDGSGHTFDFTHLDDATRGLVGLVGLMTAGAAPPPVHLLTGWATTLGELARLAIEVAGTEPSSEIVEAPARTYDVGRFVGDPSRAREVLDWRPTIGIREGLAAYARAIRERLAVGGAP